MDKTPKYAPTLTVWRIGLLIVIVNSTSFVLGLTCAGLSGEGWGLCLRSAIGSMPGVALSSIMAVVVARLISGKFEPWPIAMAFGFASMGMQAAHDGRWVAASFGVLVGSLVVGVACGIPARPGLLNGLSAKSLPGALG